jgi:uncharacterized short protein YbdD (DUF466 family)
MDDKTIDQYQKILIGVKSDIQKYIRRHYGKIPRKELSRMLGIPKYELNMLLIQMKLGR